LTKSIVVAIVDDDESARDGLMTLMESCGYSAKTFESGESFLSSSRLSDTDCLVADIHMPGMSGLELYSRLVASGQAIPTILITARDDERTRARALQAGVLCYLPKPCDETELLSCIESALGNRGATEGAS
jgi:FixJ family two-component response regulator